MNCKPDALVLGTVRPIAGSLLVESTGDLRKWKPVKALQGSGERTWFTPEQESKATNRYFRVNRRN